MYRVLWTPDAAADLEGIARYLEPRTPLHTPDIVRRLYSHAESLNNHPHRGRNGRRTGTRELIVPSLPYVIIYRVAGTRVTILRILHTALDWH